MDTTVLRSAYAELLLRHIEQRRALRK